MFAENLIEHVQSIVDPADQLPLVELPEGPLGEDTIVRPQPPDWLPGTGDNTPVMEADEEIWLPPHDGTIRIDHADVAPNPDVHAYYLPFHFYRQRWGIYIRARSVLALTAQLRGRTVLTGDAMDQATARAVFRMLLEHETFHHLTELAISRLEAVALEYMRGDSLYRQNFWSPQSVRLEEGIANAYALRSLQRSVKPLRYAVRSAVLGQIARLMERQPAGYNEFEQYLADAEFRDGQDQIITEAKVCAPRLGRRGGSDGVLPGRTHFVEKERPRVCPVRLVVEHGVTMGRIRPFPKGDGMQVYVYTRNEHPPPHFHLFMPPGREYGSYGWPTLEPVGASTELTSKQKEQVRRYIRANQPKIYRKIRAVYPNVDDMP